jgi:hypothetical protein
LNRLKELDTESSESRFARDECGPGNRGERAGHHHRTSYGSRADVGCLGYRIDEYRFEGSLPQLAGQHPDDEVLFRARGSPHQVAKPFIARSGGARALDRLQLGQRFVDVDKLQDRRVAGGKISRRPQGGVSDSDAALTRFAREHADGDLDLVRRQLAKEIGEQADLREPAAGLRDRDACLNQFCEKHAEVRKAGLKTRLYESERRIRTPNPESESRVPNPVYFLIVPVTPSGEQLNGSIFSADAAYSFLDRGNGCLKNSGSARSISTTRR